MLDYRNILRVGSDPHKSMRTMELELHSSHHTIRKVLDAAAELLLEKEKISREEFEALFEEKAG